MARTKLMLVILVAAVVSAAATVLALKIFENEPPVEGQASLSRGFSCWTAYDHRVWRRMRVLSVAAVVGALIALAGPVVQGQAVSAGSDRGRDADLAAFDKLYQQDIAATLSRDAVALTAYWTDDAVRLGPVLPAQVGKQTIRENNDRWSALPGIKVLTYVPEIKDLTILDGWAVEWRTFTGAYMETPGGEPKQILGTVLGVYKKLRDGSWKAFRAMGTTG